MLLFMLFVYFMSCFLLFMFCHVFFVFVLFSNMFQMFSCYYGVCVRIMLFSYT